MRARPTVLSLAIVVSMLASGIPGAYGSELRIRPASASPVSIATSSASVETTPLADNRVIVGLKGPVTADKLTRIYGSADTSAGAVGVLRGDTLTWHAPSGTDPAQFAKRLDDTGLVAYASPNYLRQPTGYTPPSFTQPNDPAYADTRAWGYRNDADTAWTEKFPAAQAWWLRDVNAVKSSSAGSSAWPKGYTGPDITGKHPLRADGSSIKVAVIDTGFYFSHPDAPANIEARNDNPSAAEPVNPALVTGMSSDTDRVLEVAHGTCVAGEIAAAANNGVGTLGVANDTTVRIYKVYFGGAGISDDDIIFAIEQAADDGCKVINLSLAGPDPSDGLQAAIDYAYGKGCVIVSAAGNDGANAVSYPAACNHAIAVGSVALGADGATHMRSDFSNFGKALDLVAPGEFIWGLSKPGYDVQGDDIVSLGYTWWDGTSMASPIVAGGIAWLWRAMPNLSNAAIISIVESSARDLGAAGRDNSYGYGEFDMNAAYAKLMAQYPLLAEPALTVQASQNTRDVRLAWTRVSGYHVTYDVAVDGVSVTTGLTTTGAVLPHTITAGTHTVTVAPKSPRNWTDGSEVASAQISPTDSFPLVLSLRYRRGKLLWTDTEAGTVHTDLLSIDGGAALAASGSQGSWSTSALSLGSHVASLTVRDGDGILSTPAQLTFTVRETPSVKRVNARDAYTFALAMSARRSSATTMAVLVGTKSWTSAAVAAPLARAVDGPVLASGVGLVPSATQAELARLGVTRVVIVGPTSEVGSAVTSWLTQHGFGVTRVAGSDRYSTADAVAREIAAREGGSVADGRAVVVGDSVADALSASAVAARKGWPLLFARSTSVPSSTRATLAAIGATRTLLVARTSTVSDAAKAQLPAPTRISATSSPGVGTALARWATSTYPSQFSGERIFLANASHWSTGLGVPAEAAREGALVLTTGAKIAGAVNAYYATYSEVAVRTRIVGGSATIADSVVSAIKKLVGAP